LLAAAAEVFGERGAAAPLDLVARRAGVGNATLYRHFPTRGDLIAAVYADEVSALCAHGEALLASPSPGDALFAWLGEFVAHVATKRDLALAIGNDRPDADPSPFADWHRSMHAAGAALLTRAQQSGDVHADVDPSDLLALANAIALSAAAADRRETLLRLVRVGVATVATAAADSQPNSPSRG
jgi:AcrR family transcriptional regulator